MDPVQGHYNDNVQPVAKSKNTYKIYYTFHVLQFHSILSTSNRIPTRGK